MVLAGPKGAVAYKVKKGEEGKITDKFITTHVSPAIRLVLGPAVGGLLGRALLWAAVSAPDRVTDRVQKRILFALQGWGWTQT